MPRWLRMVIAVAAAVATIMLAGELLVVAPTAGIAQRRAADTAAREAVLAARAVRAGRAAPAGARVLPNDAAAGRGGGVAAIGDGRVVWVPAPPAVDVAGALRTRLLIGLAACALAVAGWSLWAGAARRRERRHAALRQAEAVGMVVHDLRSPLTGIVLAVDRLARAVDPAGRARAQATIDRECRRLAATADDLLRLCVDTADAVERRDDDCVGQVLEDVADRLRGEHRCAVVVEATPGVDDLPSDPALSRAVANIAENAARHARGVLPIRLRAERCDGVVEITVEDDGAGIDGAFAPAPFVRGRGGGRAGLGLSSSRRVIERLGGSLSVGRSVGGGTAISLRLPERGSAP